MNTDKIWVLKLCFDGLKNLKQSLEKMFVNVNWIKYNWEIYIYITIKLKNWFFFLKK